jgi:hypothetical protein
MTASRQAAQQFTRKADPVQFSSKEKISPEFGERKFHRPALAALRLAPGASAAGGSTLPPLSAEKTAQCDEMKSRRELEVHLEAASLVRVRMET